MTPRRSIPIVLFAGMLLPLLCAHFLTSSAPRFTQPSPHLLFLANLIAERLRPPVADIGFLAPALFFWLFAHQLFRGVARVPPRTLTVVVGVALCNVLWYLVPWLFNAIYQSSLYAAETLVVNLLTASLLGLYSWKGRTSDSFLLSLTLHWLLAFWLFSYSLPYLGEHL